MLTVVPSIKGNRSLWTPSLETSPPTRSVLAEILSISSKNTIPLFSVEFFAALIILSCSINLSDSSLIKISWDSFTLIFFFFGFWPIDFPKTSEIFIMPTLAPGIPGISKDGIWLLSATAISISLSSKSPSLNLFLKLSLVATLALLPTNASKTLSSANFCAWAWTSFLFFTFSIEIAISNKSLTICSTSLPTYPTSVNLVASTFTKGASASFDSLLEISVLPTPVGPIISIFLGRTSSFISPDKACLLHLFLNAIATALFALFCPTTNLSSSETISLGESEFSIVEFSFATFSFGNVVTLVFSILYFLHT